jgi:hypothetical protein
MTCVAPFAVVCCRVLCSALLCLGGPSGGCSLGGFVCGAARKNTEHTQEKDNRKETTSALV